MKTLLEIMLLAAMAAIMAAMYAMLAVISGEERDIEKDDHQKAGAGTAGRMEVTGADGGKAGIQIHREHPG